MKVGEILRLLADDGWVVSRYAGSHRQLIHPAKRGKVTVAGKPSTTVPRGTESSILRQAGLRRDGSQAEEESG